MITNNKTYDQFLQELSLKESSSDYENDKNPFGYLGKYQMGESALIDAGYYTRNGDSTKKNDWVGQWTGKDEVADKLGFLLNHQAQENAIRLYQDKVWGYIKNKGYDQYVGQTINGIEITSSGLLAGYHLKGLGGLRDFLVKGIDVTDANGTKISSYIREC